MKKLILLSILFSGSLYAQEMVNNGDFETFSECPDYTGQLNLADYWSTYGQSPDYFNTCGEILGVQVPSNICGYQPASTGNAYAGFFPFVATTREYLGNELVAPLIIGQTYQIEFKVSLALNDGNTIGMACSHLGARLSTIPYSQFSPPAIDNSSHLVDETIISETDDWVTISGTFVADSAYQYLIIGNFYEESVYDTSNVGTNPSNRCYYYVEDVSVKRPIGVGLTKEDISYEIRYNSLRKEAIISYDENIYQPIESIQVYTATGQLVSTSNTINSNTVTIDCTTFSTGVYILQLINSNNQREQMKFVVH